MDTILEIIQTVVIGFLFFFMLIKTKSSRFHLVNGYLQIIGGLGLIFFGALVALTDEFPVLDQYSVYWNEEVRVYLETIVGTIGGFSLLAIGIWRWLPKVIEYDRQMKAELRETKKEVAILSGLLPICSACKKIRNGEGNWEQLEVYIRDHSEADFSHGICPECIQKLYPDFSK
jgi:hypothetical protein